MTNIIETQTTQVLEFIEGGFNSDQERLEYLVCVYPADLLEMMAEGGFEFSGDDDDLADAISENIKSLVKTIHG